MSRSRTAAQVLRRLESDRMFGVDFSTLSADALVERIGVASTLPAPAVPDKAAQLETLKTEAQACRLCGLGAGRDQLVFGEGAPNGDLMFVGEGPGAQEDRTGRPFVGRAGELLTKIIEAMGLTREEVYIANAVKCRPPGNRTPSPEEAQACRPFLQGQIEVVAPQVIVALGGAAVKTLLETEEGITRLRGRFQDFGGIPLMPTFHPSYLLRNPDKKRQVWDDMKKVLAKLGLPVPGQGRR